MTTFLNHAAKQKLKLLSTATTNNNTTTTTNTTNTTNNTTINTNTTINNINNINNSLHPDDTLVNTPRSPAPLTPVPKLNLTTAVEQRER